MQVQNAALAAMKDEMFELAARFTRVTKERDYMEKALNRLQVSNIIIHLESLHIFCSISNFFEVFGLLLRIFEIFFGIFLES